MSQADNVAWAETSLSIEQLYRESAARQNAGADHSFSINLGDTLDGNGLIVTSPLASLKDVFATAFPEKSSPEKSRHIYHLDQVSDENIALTGQLQSVPGKPAIALFNPTTQDVLILEKGKFNYGFVNAMALGALSRQCMGADSYQYAHAACLSVGGKGVLIIGDHKAGKSTLISKILSEAESDPSQVLALASDDWVVLKDEGGQSRATRLSQEYRIDQGTLQNPSLGLSATFNALMKAYGTPASDKASIPLEALCERMGLISTPKMPYDVIIVLNPRQKDFMQPLDQASAFTILAASTANVSPLGEEEARIHSAFWQDQFAAHESFSINNRHPDMSVQDVAKSVIKLAMK
jgi:hypothetical protein